MKLSKKWGFSLAVLAVVAGIGIFGRLWVVMDSAGSDVADNQTPLAEFHPTDGAAIKRGEYIMRLADCAACHQANFSGGYKIDTPSAPC